MNTDGMLGLQLIVTVGEPWNFCDFNNGSAEIKARIRDVAELNGKNYYLCDTEEFFIEHNSYRSLVISARHTDRPIEQVCKYNYSTINGKCLPPKRRGIGSEIGNNLPELLKYIANHMQEFDGLIGSIRPEGG